MRKNFESHGGDDPHFGANCHISLLYRSRGPSLQITGPRSRSSLHTRVTGQGVLCKYVLKMVTCRQHLDLTLQASPARLLNPSP